MLIKHLYPLIFILAVIFTACKKKQNTTLGTDVQPVSDALNVEISDSSSIFLFSQKHPRTRSYQDQYKYLGSNQDPIFGRTDASIFTNFAMPNNVSNISFGLDAVLDSAELVLTFTQSFVGDTTNALLYEVFQLTQKLNKTANYYLDTMLTYNSSALASVWRRVSKTDGFYTIRLPLKKSYAEAIITNPQYLVNNETFLNTYKGFFITTKSTNNLNPNSKPGSLNKIDLDNPVSGVYVYYHNGTPVAGKEPKRYRFPFSGDNSSRFNHIEYNYLSGGNNLLIQQIQDMDSTKGKQNIFLKGVGSVRSIIRIPFLKNYSDASPISVNRAELTLRVDQSFLNAIGTYEPPPQISLVAIDSAGREIYVKDQFFSADILKFGGLYDAVGKKYVFNISRHAQEIVSGRIKNYGFYIVVANPDRIYVARRDVRAERVVFGGTDNLTYKPSFRLTYVRFPYDK